jgi:hypothetical protein
VPGQARLVPATADMTQRRYDTCVNPRAAEPTARPARQQRGVVEVSFVDGLRRRRDGDEANGTSAGCVGKKPPHSCGECIAERGDQAQRTALLQGNDQSTHAVVVAACSREVLRVR